MPQSPPCIATPSVLDAFRRREPSAMRALYRDYGRLVYAVALRVLGRADLADDATQRTFVRAWQAAGRFDVDRDPAPWLAAIARRVALDVLRHEARRPADHLETDVAATVSDAGTLDLVWRVRGAIDTLAPEEATVARLQHLDGLTQAEIADRLGIALGTVKSRSHRAHRKLAVLLDDLRRGAVQ